MRALALVKGEPVSGWTAAMLDDDGPTGGFFRAEQPLEW